MSPSDFLSSSPVQEKKRVVFVQALGAALVLAFFLFRPEPAAAQFRDIGYTLEPTVQGIGEGKAASFQNDPLYGAALGLSFGRYFQASAEYLVNTGLTTDFANVGRLRGLLNRKLDLRRYGGRIRFNLYDRRVLPYLTVGTGVLRFDPEGTEASRTIYAVAGGGITFSAYDRYRISIGGEVLSYRYDPVATFLGPTGTENFKTGTVLVSSPALNASISLFLGGRSLEEQTAVDQALREQFGGRGLLRGVRLFANPFYGRVEFNEALGFPKDQNFTGINAGVSLGPYVGLRGFYWRGAQGARVTDDFAGGFENIAMYGGELQLRLNLGLGQGFVPYGKVGGGYLDVLTGYADDIPEGTSPPEDRFLVLSGLGLEVPLAQSIKLSGGVRGLFMNNPNAVEAGDPGDIYGSLMYSAGIEVRLGGPERSDPKLGPQPLPSSEGPSEDSDTAATAPDRAQEEMPAPASMTERERRLLARVDSLEKALQALRERPRPDSLRRAGSVPERPASGARRSNLSGQTMTVPVPEEGEIYIRFGDGSVSTATARKAPESAPQEPPVSENLDARLRKTLWQELRERAQSDTAEALGSADIERLVQQALRGALDRRETAGDRQQEEARRRLQETQRRQQKVHAQQVRRLQRQIEALQRQLREEIADPRLGHYAHLEAAPSGPFYQEMLGRPLTYLVPIGGLRAGEGPDQVHFGLRGDYRLSRSSRFHLLPELSFGVGDGEKISPTILFNAAYSFLRKTTPALTGVPIEPYVGAGVGIASDGGFTFEPVTNVMAGFNYRFQSGRAFFLEYSTLDLFNTHRVHLGARIWL